MKTIIASILTCLFVSNAFALETGSRVELTKDLKAGRADRKIGKYECFFDNEGFKKGTIFEVIDAKRETWVSHISFMAGTTIYLSVEGKYAKAKYKNVDVAIVCSDHKDYWNPFNVDLHAPAVDEALSYFKDVMVEI